MWAYGFGLKHHGIPPLSIKHKNLAQFSTHVDCHLLSDCCLLAISLYKMGSHSITSTPSMSDLSTASNEEEVAESLGPAKPTEESAATVKTTCAASQLAPLLLREGMPPLRYPWGEVTQCSPAPEGFPRTTL